MKKVLLAAMVLLAGASFTSCSSSDDDGTIPGAEKPNYKIHDNNIVGVWRGIVAALAERRVCNPSKQYCFVFASLSGRVCPAGTDHYRIRSGASVRNGRALEAKAGRGLVAALLLFVGIPLPGTGAWTGTLAASILDMKFKDVLIACMGGVLLAGIIMGLASAGLLGALSGLFAV